MTRVTDEELIALGKEYGVEVKITTLRTASKGEIVFLPGIKPRPTDGEEPKRRPSGSRSSGSSRSCSWCSGAGDDVR